MAPKNGFDCVLLRNSASHASPTWVAQPNIKDVRVSDANIGESEVLVRGSRFAAFLAGGIRLGFDVDYLYLPGDTQFEFFKDAALAMTKFELWFADGPAATVGTQGLRCYVQIFGFPFNQNLEETAMLNFKLKPTWFDVTGSRVVPDWFETEA